MKNFEQLFLHRYQFTDAELEKCSHFFHRYNHLITITQFVKNKDFIEIYAQYEEVVFSLKYNSSETIFLYAVYVREKQVLHDLLISRISPEFSQRLNQKLIEIGATANEQEQFELAVLLTVMNNSQLVYSYLDWFRKSEIEQKEKNIIITELKNYYHDNDNSTFLCVIPLEQVSISKLEKIRTILQRKKEEP